MHMFRRAHAHAMHFIIHLYASYRKSVSVSILRAVLGAKEECLLCIHICMHYLPIEHPIKMDANFWKILSILNTFSGNLNVYFSIWFERIYHCKPGAFPSYCAAFI